MSEKSDMSHYSLSYPNELDENSPLYLAVLNFSNGESESAIHAIELPKKLISSHSLEFLNDFGMATEKKSLSIMTSMVKTYPDIANKAYQDLAIIINWLMVSHKDTESYQELNKILGALVHLYRH